LGCSKFSEHNAGQVGFTIFTLTEGGGQGRGESLGEKQKGDKCLKVRKLKVGGEG